MSLILKVVVTLVLAGLFVSGLATVISELLSRFSSDSLPRFEASDTDDGEYSEHEMLTAGGERDRQGVR